MRYDERFCEALKSDMLLSGSDEESGVWSGMMLPALLLLVAFLAWHFRWMYPVALIQCCPWLPSPYLLTGLAGLIWLAAKLSRKPAGQKDEGYDLFPESNPDRYLEDALNGYREYVRENYAGDLSYASEYVFIYYPDINIHEEGWDIRKVPREDKNGHFIYSPAGFGALFMTDKELLYASRMTDCIRGAEISSHEYRVSWNMVQSVIVNYDILSMEDIPLLSKQLMILFILGTKNIDLDLNSMDDILLNELFEDAFVVKIDIDIWGYESARKTLAAILTDIERHLKKTHGPSFDGIRSGNDGINEIIQELIEHTYPVAGKDRI